MKFIEHRIAFAAVAAALFASLAAMTARGAIVWDTTESGRLMTAAGGKPKK